MTLTTRLLPLAMVAAWVFGLVVPLLDSGAGDGSPDRRQDRGRPTISSLTWFAGCAALFVAGARSMSQPS